MIFQQGLIGPDPEQAKALDLAVCPLPGFVRATDTTGGSIGRIAWIRDQDSYPSCAGQASIAVTDAMGCFGYGSAIDTWLDSQLRWLKHVDVNQGTYLIHVVESLVNRGVSPYRPGEDTDIALAGWRGSQDSLRDELTAHDRRIGEAARRYRIPSYGAARLQDVMAALSAGYGVLGGFGVKDGFCGYEASARTGDRVLSSDELGGSRDGHAMRVVGYTARDGRWIFLLQNSWSEHWGGARLPDGCWQPGCCWVEGNVVIEAWDLHVIEVRRAA